MKHSLIFTLAVCGGMIAVSGHAAPSDLPTPWPISRYDTLIAKSPFAVATAATSGSGATPGFATSLYVSGIAKIGNSNFVTIASRDTNAKQPSFSLTTNGAPTPDGIQLVGVQWADQLAKAQVTIKKGNDVATIQFDQQVLQKNLQPVQALETPAPDSNDRSGRHRPDFRNMDPAQREAFFQQMRDRRMRGGDNSQQDSTNGNPSTMPQTRMIRRSSQIQSAP